MNLFSNSNFQKLLCLLSFQRKKVLTLSSRESRFTEKVSYMSAFIASTAAVKAASLVG